MKKRIYVLFLSLICLLSSLQYPVYANEATGGNESAGDIIQDDETTGDEGEAEIITAPVITVKNVASSGVVQITWQPVEGAVSYKVYRSESLEGTYQQVYKTGGTSYKNTSAATGIQYFYKVQATAENGQISEWSNVVSGTRDLARPVVTASNVESSGKIRLTWETVEGAVKYQIYRSAAKDGTYKLMYTTTSTSYTNTSANPGVRYYYKVRAIAENREADSADSAVKSRLCDLARPVVTASNVAATGKVRLTWKTVEGAVQYKVYRSESENGTYKLMYTTKGTSYTNTSAKPGVRYYYKVRAIAENTYANSALSVVDSRLCDLAQPVVTTSNVAESGKVRLTWKKVEGAVGYKVYRSTSKNGTYKLTYTTKGTSYTNTSAKAGTRYYYKVRAIAENTYANSAPSAVTSRVCDLPRPVLRIFNNENGKPRITWDAVDGAVQYKVYRSTEKNSGYKLMYTTTGTTYTNTKAEIGTEYYYKVRAVAENTVANSAYSQIVQGEAVANVYQYIFSSFETYQYGTEGRNTNMTLACEAINGTILAPGDSFSFNEVVGPRTEKKGYQIATVFNDVGYGRGGGICQVATTLFNTVLYGNLEVTLRYNHSLTVGYVQLGRDATIYTTKKDLRFVNNSNYYIKIYAKSEDGHVEFKFLTREKNVSPKKDVELKVTEKDGVYTLKRYYKGTVNYTATSEYKND